MANSDLNFISSHLKARPHEAFFVDMSVNEHDLMNIIYLKFAMTDQVEA